MNKYTTDNIISKLNSEINKLNKNSTETNINLNNRNNNTMMISKNKRNQRNNSHLYLYSHLNTDSNIKSKNLTLILNEDKNSFSRPVNNNSINKSHSKCACLKKNLSCDHHHKINLNLVKNDIYKEKNYSNKTNIKSIIHNHSNSLLFSLDDLKKDKLHVINKKVLKIPKQTNLTSHTSSSTIENNSERNFKLIEKFNRVIDEKLKKFSSRNKDKEHCGNLISYGDLKIIEKFSLNPQWTTFVSNINRVFNLFIKNIKNVKNISSTIYTSANCGEFQNILTNHQNKIEELTQLLNEHEIASQLFKSESEEEIEQLKYQNKQLIRENKSLKSENIKLFHEKTEINKLVDELKNKEEKLMRILYSLNKKGKIIDQVFEQNTSINNNKSLDNISCSESDIYLPITLEPPKDLHKLEQIPLLNLTDINENFNLDYLSPMNQSNNICNIPSYLKNKIKSVIHKKYKDKFIKKILK